MKRSFRIGLPLAVLFLILFSVAVTADTPDGSALYALEESVEATGTEEADSASVSESQEPAAEPVSEADASQTETSHTAEGLPAEISSETDPSQTETTPTAEGLSATISSEADVSQTGTSPESAEPASAPTISAPRNVIPETSAPANEAVAVQTQISITGATVTGIKDRIYTGAVIRPALKVYIKSGEKKILLSEGIDYEILTSHAKNVGTAHVTVRGIGKYKGDVQNTFEILPAKIRAAKLKYPSLQYTGVPRTQNKSILVKARVNKQPVTLKYGRDFTVTYKKNTKVGTATAIIKGTGNYTGTLKKTFKIVPKGTSITNIVYGSGHIAVKWAKQGVQTTGYQLQCSRNKAFTDIVKGFTIKSKSKLSKTVYDLTPVKNYYLRVRTYKTVSGKRYYSAWSKVTKATLLNNIRIKGSGSTRTIVVNNPKASYKSMKAAVWSEEGGQDDMKWYPMAKKDGAWKVTVPLAGLKHNGLCNVHIYKGNTFIGSAEFTCKLSNTAISWDPSWEFADYSAVHTDSGYLYRAPSNRRGIIIGINAGHGTGDYTHYVYSHPDHSPKTTGGSTAEGSVYTMCDNYGMSFNDGEIEANVTFRQAEILRDLLLDNGYDVLMVRTQSSCGLDVIARTVMCNNIADCHIALHWDGEGFGYDKGCFYTSVPDAMKNMYPTSTVWEKSNSLGDNLINGLRSQGIGVFESGSIDTDLMQTSYSTIPSVDLELGNQCSPHDDGRLTANAKGILAGLNSYFK